MADVMGASLYKLVNAMAGNEVTDAEAKEATAGKTFGEVSDELTGEIVAGDLPIGTELPKATAEDVGKNLVVDDEDKIVVQKVFKVEITGSGGGYSTTVTPNEVLEHYQKGEKIIASITGLFDVYDFTFTIHATGAIIPAPILVRSQSIYPNGVLMLDFTAPQDHDEAYNITVFMIPFAT